MATRQKWADVISLGEPQGERRNHDRRTFLPPALHPVGDLDLQGHRAPRSVVLMSSFKITLDSTHSRHLEELAKGSEVASQTVQRLVREAWNRRTIPPPEAGDNSPRAQYYRRMVEMSGLGRYPEHT